MAEQVALINLRPVWARLPLLVLAFLALAASWYGMRWMIGDTMAEAAPLSYQNDPQAAFETAEAAVRLAPHDPLAYLTLARLHRYSFDPELLREPDLPALISGADSLDEASHQSKNPRRPVVREQ